MSQAGSFTKTVIPSNPTELEGNTGGPISRDANDIIYVVGDGTTVNVTGNPATHTLTIEATQEVATDYDTDSGVASPILNVLDVLGGDNINTEGATNEIHINLNKSINQPATNNIMPPNAGSEGWYSINDERFLHAYGTDNTFLGSGAGNNTLTGSGNIGIGVNALAASTSQSNVIAIGNNVLKSSASIGSGVFIGHGLLENQPFSSRNNGVFIGNNIANSFSVSSISSNCVVIGDGALTSGPQDPDSTVLIGSGVLSNSAVPSAPVNSVYIGRDAGRFGGGYDGVAIGHVSGGNGNITLSVVVGASAGRYTGSTSNTNNNVFLGYNSANISKSGSGTLSSCSQNIFIGYESGKSANNSAIDDLNRNVFIGYQCGSGLSDTSVSDNIYIGNLPHVSGENNVIRIGKTGSGSHEQNKFFAAGIASVSVSNAEMVVIDTTTGQLGSQSIPSGTSFAWNTVAGTSQSMAVNNGYICTNGSLTTATLPATAAVGSIIRITAAGSGLVKVAQNAGQTLHFGNTSTTTGATGYIQAQEQYDAVELLCITADTDFVVLSGVGNWTIV